MSWNIFAFLLLISGTPFVNSQTSTSIPTTSGPPTCPGGSVAYQDIAILWDLSFFPDDSLDLSTKIGTAIYSQLFAGPTYRFFDDFGQVATRITPIPFPNTDKYRYSNGVNNYGYIWDKTVFQNTIVRSQLQVAGKPFVEHPTNSTIHNALSYLTKYLQAIRDPPIVNTIVIIAKRDNDVGQSQSFVTNLKISGSKIMTIGIGDASNVGNLASLSSGTGYNFVIPNISDTNYVNGIASQIAQQLTTDCGTTWTPTIPTTTSTTTRAPTTTGPTTTTSTSTSTTPVTTTPQTTTTGTTTISSTTPPITTTTTPLPQNVTTSTTMTVTPSSTSAAPTGNTTTTPPSETTTTSTSTPATTTVKTQYRGGNSNRNTLSITLLSIIVLFMYFY